MQINGANSAYSPSQLASQLLSAVDSSGASTGQGAASASTSSDSSSSPSALTTAGVQFDSATLASLLSVQTQDPGDDASASTTPQGATDPAQTGHHHHHGHHGGVSSTSDASGASASTPSIPDASSTDPTTASLLAAAS